MPWVSVDCPVCGEEIRFRVEMMEGGYPEEELCEITDSEGQCHCALTDEQQEAIEQQAIDRVDWSPSDYEGDY